MGSKLREIGMQTAGYNTRARYQKIISLAFQFTRFWVPNPLVIAQSPPYKRTTYKLVGKD